MQLCIAHLVRTLGTTEDPCRRWCRRCAREGTLVCTFPGQWGNRAHSSSQNIQRWSRCVYEFVCVPSSVLSKHLPCPVVHQPGCCAAPATGG